MRIKELILVSQDENHRIDSHKTRITEWILTRRESQNRFSQDENHRIDSHKMRITESILTRRESQNRFSQDKNHWIDSHKMRITESILTRQESQNRFSHRHENESLAKNLKMRKNGQKCLKKPENQQNGAQKTWIQVYTGRFSCLLTRRESQNRFSQDKNHRIASHKTRITELPLTRITSHNDSCNIQIWESISLTESNSKHSLDHMYIFPPMIWGLIILW